MRPSFARYKLRLSLPSLLPSTFFSLASSVAFPGVTALVTFSVKLSKDRARETSDK